MFLHQIQYDICQKFESCFCIRKRKDMEQVPIVTVLHCLIKVTVSLVMKRQTFQITMNEY